MLTFFYKSKNYEVKKFFNLNKIENIKNKKKQFLHRYSVPQTL